MKVWRGLAFGDHTRYDDVDDVTILRVHAAERVQRAGLVHDLVHKAIVDHQHVRVGHKELERRDAFGHHRFHLCQTLRAIAGAKVGDGHVQPEIDARFPLALAQPGFERLSHGMAA
jgi:hypothetical protein